MRDMETVIHRDRDTWRQERHRDEDTQRKGPIETETHRDGANKNGDIIIETGTYKDGDI